MVRFQAGEPGATGRDAEGRYIISGLNRSVMEEMVTSLALRADRSEPGGTVVPQPRLGLFRPWSASMDEGWTRWVLEQYGFEFSSVRNADFSSGPLGDRFDVLILADYGARTIVGGIGAGSIVPRYAGGIGEAGIRALEAFVSEGGTLVCLNGSCGFAIEALDLPVRDVTTTLGRGAFSASGSIVEATVDRHHPVVAGMPSRSSIFFSRSPVFTVTEDFDGAALAYYQKSGSPLLSGFLQGEEHMNGYAAALDVRHGAGHVILIGFKPQWRGQPFGTFRVLFNAALFHGPHADSAAGAPGFWMTPPGDERSDSDREPPPIR